MRRLLDWIDARTGVRAARSWLLDERLPRGTGWAFTTGSAVMLLLGVQFATGVVLAMYYVPSPVLAYDSLRFVMRDLPMGAMVRGLHVWGASFLVVASAIHLLRAFAYGAYKAPRELTWLSGLVALLAILAFALSGYLLPWDQKAYWATTVTINVARSTPVVGGVLADVLRGGADLGAITLGRWYVAHVFLLPALLVGGVVAHLYLMRRHGISGPLRPRGAGGVPFFPWHVVKDSVVMGAVFASLALVAWLVPAPLDGVANPADASYVPRPEWYFLSLFQLLKYFPGALEPVATQVMPALAVLFLVLLPFLDRGPERRPWSPSRRWVTLAMAGLVAAVATLTALGLRDTGPGKDREDWGLLPIAGLELATGDQSRCRRCHVDGGPGAPLEHVRLTRDDEWLLNHMRDPVAIAPGVRTADDRPPRPEMDRLGAQAVVAYLRREYAGEEAPAVAPATRLAAMTYARTCVACHRVSGEGGTVGPDLSHVGSRRSLEEIRAVIEDASLVYGESVMPAFKGRLTSPQIDALAAYFAARK